MCTPDSTDAIGRNKRFPARLHVLLAREAPLGVVIRRGPAKHVAALLWNRDTDEFSLGQWLKGRIYERRADLSPDGKHLIYFAMNGKWDDEAKGAWTAISRAPWLKGIAVFPKGDCWHGGGLWSSETRYRLNDGYGHSPALRNTDEVQREDEEELFRGYGGECLSAYYPRLFRDGWRWVDEASLKTNGPDLFEKMLPAGWILRKAAHRTTSPPPGKGCYWDEHELLHPSSRKRNPHADWEWADLDRDRLVWTTGGKLFCATLTSEGSQDETMLCDFNDLYFKAIEAPY